MHVLLIYFTSGEIPAGFPQLAKSSLFLSKLIVSFMFREASVIDDLLRGFLGVF